MLDLVFLACLSEICKSKVKGWLVRKCTKLLVCLRIFLLGFH